MNWPDQETATDSESNERIQMVGEFIEIFEDFLNEKGIQIPNDEKNEDPFASNIYGTDYGNLESRIEQLLINIGALKGE